MALSVDVVKVIVLLSLLGMTFLCGIFPVLLLRLINRVRANDENSSLGVDEARTGHQRNHHEAQIASYQKYISFLSCFAAGVFLATCFLDLLPNVQHNLIRVLDRIEVYTGFPVAEFVMVIGLFLILIVEQIVLTMQERRFPGRHTGLSADTDSDARQPLLSHSRTTGGNRDEMTESYHSDYSISGISDQPSDLLEPGQRQRHIQGVIYTQDDAYGERQTTSSDSRSGEDGAASHHPIERQNSLHSEHSLQTHSPLRAMLLVCALSLHSVFEGLTIGLLTKLEDILSIFAALALHKSILSFSLGMNLIQSRISLKSIIKSVVFFSLASPVGIGIGIGVTDLWNSVSSGLIHGLLQGIASGTFLYIIFFEILPKEFNSGSHRLLKVLFLILGYATVTGILFLSDEVKHPFCVINQNPQ